MNIHDSETTSVWLPRKLTGHSLILVAKSKKFSAFSDQICGWHSTAGFTVPYKQYNSTIKLTADLYCYTACTVLASPVLTYKWTDNEWEFRPDKNPPTKSGPHVSHLLNPAMIQVEILITNK